MVSVTTIAEVIRDTKTSAIVDSDRPIPLPIRAVHWMSFIATCFILRFKMFFVAADNSLHVLGYQR